MSEAQIEQIELDIQEAKKLINAKEHLLRLESYPAFNELIVEGYFKKEASRLVMMKANPATQDDETQHAINKAIDSIGGLQQYFNKVINLGSMAESSLDSHEATREELLMTETGG